MVNIPDLQYCSSPKFQETQKPKHVTMIRHKLLGIRQSAMTLIVKYGNRGKFPALVALSSIMYLDYTCGMVR